MIPIGKSRDGFLHSSADVATASKPMYEKNTIAAPLMTPLVPNGKNGFRLAMSACGVAIATKAIIADNVTTTRMALSLALCFVPRMRTKQSRRMMMIDGKLTKPPSAGVLSR